MVTRVEKKPQPKARGMDRTSISFNCICTAREGGREGGGEGGRKGWKEGWKERVI